MTRKKLPIGFEDFEEIISGEYYYVDKTLFIKELLDNLAKVSLFLRPRRFGKTLALSMLKYFVEDTGDQALNAARRELFCGLKIMNQGAAYTERMTSSPVINLTLKSVKQPDFELAMSALKDAVAGEFHRRHSITDSLSTPGSKEKFRRIEEGNGNLDDYNTSLYFLSKCLHEVTGRKVVVLIDEYDVPLDGAWFNGYYNEMIGFIRTFFESALKTNPFLEFAVITGCLRVSQESIFTGLNNLDVISMFSGRYGGYFGFTQDEVDDMLHYYGRESRREDFRLWYDGYRIGNAEIYNPWSAIKCLVELIVDENAFLTPHWVNTSSNDIVRRLVDEAGNGTRQELEILMSGGVIEKTVSENVTYKDLEHSGDRLWDFLFFTGYLTLDGKRQEGPQIVYRLKIVNTEVMLLFEDIIVSWFKNSVKNRDTSVIRNAFIEGDAKTIEEEISEALFETISYHDYGEDFYHGFMAGLLNTLGNYGVRSNREAGLGRPDITLIPARRKDPYIIIEFKTTKNQSDMETVCEAALEQIASQRYAEEAQKEGWNRVVCYGIAFWKKQALVRIAG